MPKAILMDTTKCIGCRGCQVACKQWKNIPAEQAEYETVYRFKETYFWNKDFNRYIQYKARITKDTTGKIYSEPVSIASETVVGVLSFDSGILRPNPNSVYVVLPDGRIVWVDKEILEKIESENEQDR